MRTLPLRIASQHRTIAIPSPICPAALARAAMAHKRREHDYDFQVPWALVDGDVAHALADDEDSEQHKKRRGTMLRKRSIRHYRHATGRWGAALESFKPIWVGLVLVWTWFLF